MKAVRWFAALAAIGAVATSGAQGFRMMGGGGGALSKGMVLFQFGQGGMTLRSDVSKELALTDSQKSKLEDFQQKQMEEMMGMFQGGQRPSQEEMQSIMKKRQESEDKALKETLDEKQQNRLKELWIQRLGNSAITHPDLQKDLGVTDEQKAKIKDLQTKQNEANRSIFEKMQNGEIDRSEIRPLMDKNTKAMNDELGKLMTDEQRGKLKTLSGAPFKFDEDGN